MPLSPSCPWPPGLLRARPARRAAAPSAGSIALRRRLNGLCRPVLIRPRRCDRHDADSGDNAEGARTAADAVRRIGGKLAALAQDGLAYTADEYDPERYRQGSPPAAQMP